MGLRRDIPAGSWSPPGPAPARLQPSEMAHPGWRQTGRASRRRRGVRPRGRTPLHTAPESLRGGGQSCRSGSQGKPGVRTGKKSKSTDI